VAAVEALSQSEDGGKGAHRSPATAAENGVLVVTTVRRRPPVIPRQKGDGINLVGLEATQVAVLDQVIRVFVVTLVRDVDADVMEKGGVFQPLALAIGERVNAARLFEQRHRDLRHMIGMFRPVVAALRQLDHASPPDVGIAIRLRDLLAMAGDVIEDQPLAQREIAQRQLGSPEPMHDGVEQEGSGDREIGAPRIEPRYTEPLFERQGDNLFSQATQLFCGDAAIAQRDVRGVSLFGRRDRAQTEDRA
jgi:hypothetical protein